MNKEFSFKWYNPFTYLIITMLIIISVIIFVFVLLLKEQKP
jgi:hypothetical protein